ncbi:hypothetical protein AVEN_126667-1 [Araneus ventricosus]|uniref:Uncharacterized protein n=1 Tax=Araneus ventricosus TaxID=182803 RepID=A0A4Y2NM02_ARAVE|nr:hypothetical protein AVEN_126667-1 [Araneus ventricosus]
MLQTGNWSFLAKCTASAFALLYSLGNIYTGADISNTEPGGLNGKLVTLALPRHLGFNWMMVVTTAIRELGVES